jgi:hypothetical protein
MQVFAGPDPFRFEEWSNQCNSMQNELSDTNMQHMAARSQGVQRCRSAVVLYMSDRQNPSWQLARIHTCLYSKGQSAVQGRMIEEDAKSFGLSSWFFKTFL